MNKTRVSTFGMERSERSIHYIPEDFLTTQATAMNGIVMLIKPLVWLVFVCYPLLALVMKPVGLLGA